MHRGFVSGNKNGGCSWAWPLFFGAKYQYFKTLLFFETKQYRGKVIQLGSKPVRGAEHQRSVTRDCTAARSGTSPQSFIVAVIVVRGVGRGGVTIAAVAGRRASSGMTTCSGVSPVSGPAMGRMGSGL